MKPLRICLIGPASNIHTRRWAHTLAERGHQLLIVSDETAPELRVPAFNPRPSMGPLAHIPKVRGWWASVRASQAIREFAPDIVHLHWLHAARSTAYLIARRPRVVISVWGRDVVWDGPGPEPRRRAEWIARILARARAVTATSAFLARRVQEASRGTASARVIPFGVDCLRFRPLPHAPPAEPPIIGFLKHYLPKYGPEVLLRAVALLARRGARFRLLMYGTGDPAPYHALVRELSLGTVAELRGTLRHEDVPAVMQRFDIYAMPSVFESESFGVSAVEAAACGVPVVASRVGGVPEVVDDGVTGLLTPPGDPVALAGALADLLGDPERRLRFGRAGRDRVVKLFEWNACVDLMEGLYEQVMGASGSRVG